MNEADWLTGPDPWPLWHRVGDLDQLTDRKKRLFCVAACRRVAEHLTDPRSRRMLEACEAFADGTLDFDALFEADRAAFAAAREVENAGASGEARLAAHGAKWLGPDDTKLGRAATFSSEVFGFAALVRAGVVEPTTALNDALPFWHHPAFVAAHEAEERVQAGTIRELFGNPFRPVDVDPAWRNATVVVLAEGIYADRAFDRLPILADALQDAGCEIGDLLAHCRDPDALHVRGCWAVDLVLGKA